MTVSQEASVYRGRGGSIRSHAAQVPDWRAVKSNRGAGPARHSLLSEHALSQERSSPKTSKVKAKGQTSGRTYTSKYRGVHQTFPTKRWEAQFRLECPST